MFIGDLRRNCQWAGGKPGIVITQKPAKNRVSVVPDASNGSVKMRAKN